jgi:hypothetical protein
MKDLLQRILLGAFLGVALFVGGCQLIGDLGLWPYVIALFFPGPPN